MTMLLNIQSSPNLVSSASREVSRKFIERYADNHPGLEVVELDLVTNPPAHFGADHLGAFFAPPEAHTEEFAAALRQSEDYIAQLMRADVVVIGTPMHNLGVASVLKSWIDNVVRVGRTFSYNEMGQIVGLMAQKKFVIVVSSGGVYSAPPMSGMDHSASYVEAVFRFLGMTDVTCIRAEGMSMGPEMAAMGLAGAMQGIEHLAV